MRRAADVLVVGGGPAGAAAAAELAVQGRRVMLAEASPGPRDRVCGEFVSAESVPLLKRMGALLAVRGALPVALRHARFTTPSGRELEIRVDGALGLSRRLLDEALLEAAERRGAQVLRGARFLELLRDHRGGICGARLRVAGERVPVKASLVIGADGRSSAVARDAGLDRPADGPHHCAIKAHFRHGPSFEGLEDQVEVHLFPGGYVGIQPVEGERVNVSAVVEARISRRLRGGALAILQGAVRQNPLARRRLQGARAAGAPLSLFPLERDRRAVLADGLLLAGDAARVVPPFLGDGIAAALCSGLLAAETACSALDAGDVTVAGLSAYRAGRRRHLALAGAVGLALQQAIYRPRLAEALVASLRRTPALPQFLLRSTRLL